MCEHFYNNRTAETAVYLRKSEIQVKKLTKV